MSEFSPAFVDGHTIEVPQSYPEVEVLPGLGQAGTTDPTVMFPFFMAFLVALTFKR